MKKKLYTQGITIFATPEMYRDLRCASDELGISLSDLLRRMIQMYFKEELPGGLGQAEPVQEKTR